jgi:predicted transcriptional regulator
MSFLFEKGHGVSVPTAIAPLLEHTIAIVSAYVSHNSVDAASLSDVIREIRGALLRATAPSEPSKPEAVPAVPIKKSVAADAITCLYDGKKFKTLRRHLRISHGETPKEYREKWKLPASYPLIAPVYAEQRSRVAKEIGLGRAKGKPKRGRTRG